MVKVPLAERVEYLRRRMAAREAWYEDTRRIVAATLSASDVDDASQVGPLLDQVVEQDASFTADGAYDREGVYGDVVARHPDAAVIVLPRSNAVPSDTASTAPANETDICRISASTAG